MRVTRGELHERARRSFYSDASADPDAVRVCRGTSCLLAGAPTPSLAGGRERGVYCLGYCDRGPARLDPDGRVECAEAPRVPVRCTAREAVVTRRIREADHSDLARARAAGAYDGLTAALDRSPEWVLDTVEASGERGRGGGGFPTGAKWRRCASVPADQRVVVANGDEGDPGSFVDRVLLERDPHAVLEGLALCAYAVGASQGFVYIRSEYVAALQRLERAVLDARASGLLGPSILGSDFALDVHVVAGQGSYVCGEETALLEALEGRRGEVRLRPPYPVDVGFEGRPTVVNNVETLVNAPWIVQRGASAFRALGTQGSPGTKVLSLNVGFARPGLLEVEYGTSLRSVIESEAGGGRDGTALEGVILGGPMGCVLPRDEWDVPVDPAALAARGAELGHGGLVALPAGSDYAALLRHWLEFMAEESCGKCVPCRIGSRRAFELAGRLDEGGNRERLAVLLGVMRDASLCGFGQRLPVPAARLLSLCSRPQPAGVTAS